ncbi:MAG TPA: bifunctional 2-polyprenyl-6-hydroxyphenol methylase/3-demethylubiquinol 3-O-methyltransferase UbiG [Micavibrio sp.]
MAATTNKGKSSTIDPAEISHFAKDSDRWWDENGPFAPLHRLNPVRIKFIRDAVTAHFDRPAAVMSPLAGLKILDIGCGGGLVCEPLSRMGADVTGIDADAVAIAAARSHATATELDIDYRVESTDNLKGQYDVVLALEIVEHVASVDKFVEETVGLCKPGGLVVFSTLNRTPKSFALGIVAAEYILRWVPTGTHNWRKFVRPSELAAALRCAGAKPKEIKGLRLNPFKNEFEISVSDIDVNYFMVAEKAKKK